MVSGAPEAAKANFSTGLEREVPLEEARRTPGSRRKFRGGSPGRGLACYGQEGNLSANQKML
jgi:hypothetical protein